MKRRREKVLGFVVDVVGVKPTFAKTYIPGGFHRKLDPMEPLFL